MAQEPAMIHPKPQDPTGVTLPAIRTRHAGLSDVILHTPVVPATTPLLDRLLGGDLWLKLESLQRTGTFKARGALSVARSLPANVLSPGITAVSAGNHAIAAAWTAQQLGVSARVVMQNTASRFRIDLARAYGADVILTAPGAPAFAEVQRLERDEGRAFIHPFEGLDTTLGAAGVGLEMIEDIPDLDAVVVAVGGGGLMSGVASAIKLIRPACAVYGVEPVGAASVTKSLAAGVPVTLERIDTVADSLSPPMALPFSLSVIERFVDDMVTVTDAEICAGMVLLHEQCKQAVEPAAGAAMAAALGPLRKRLHGRRVVVLVCGTNIDHASHARLLATGAQHVAALIA
jgi:threonine dehydratase